MLSLCQKGWLGTPRQRPRGLRFLSLGEVTFEAPGPIEKNLLLAGSMVRGQVVDGSTGRPLQQKGIQIRAINRDSFDQNASGLTDSEGRFTVFELQPGVYHFHAQDPDLATGFVNNVEVASGEVIDDLMIPIPPSGKVLFRCFGFDKTEPIMIVFWDPATPNAVWASDVPYNPETGLFERTCPLRAGDWCVQIEVTGLGQTVREFTVFVSATVEVIVNRNDFEPYPGDITVIETLTGTDGIPLGDTPFCFYATGIPGADGAYSSVEGRTGPDGAFSVSGFKPGLWYFRAEPPAGGQIELEPIVILPDPPNPFACRLVAPRATIRAHLCNAATGKSLDARTRGSVCLIDPDRDLGVAEPRAFLENPLSMKWLPRGTYRLRIAARGYREYQSAPLVLVDGGTLALGRIDFEPTGMVIFECVDVLGGHVPSTPKFPGLPGEYYFPVQDRHAMPEGKCLCWYLPFGEVKVRFEHPGYVTRDVTVFIERGRCDEHRIEL